MGDSETVVAQTSTVMEYTSAGYTSADYDTNSVAVPDAADNETGASEDLVSSTASKDAAHALSDGSNLGDGSRHVTHSDSVMQEAPASTTYDTNPSVAATSSVTQPGLEDAAADMPQVSGYDSSVNGNVASEATNLTIAENGTASGDVGGVIPEQHVEDGSVPAISAEEDRLWSIVRANCLDFNAWTALIEETEKVAENNISKIRRVYDAFLAEFPLCYGYWKKYADHEARLGSMDKVVEVYERAVQGVTYSVDIWLHYCSFSISTYGDPDTIRSVSSHVWRKGLMGMHFRNNLMCEPL